VDRESFLKEQNRIYGLIEQAGSKVDETGIRRDKGLTEKSGGFSIAIQYGAYEAPMRFSLFSRAVSGFVPAVAYQAKEIHSTLGFLGRGSNFYYDPENKEHAATLDLLCQIAEALQNIFGERSCNIRFDRYLLGPETILAAGEPDETFVGLVTRAEELAKFFGLSSWKSAWGAHVTVSRFKTAVPAERVKRLIEFVQGSRPPANDIAQHIVVGYSWWDSAGPQDNVNGQFVAHRAFQLWGN
jgi:hypothetical protein